MENVAGVGTENRPSLLGCVLVWVSVGPLKDCTRSRVAKIDAAISFALICIHDHLSRFTLIPQKSFLNDAVLSLN